MCHLFQSSEPWWKLLYGIVQARSLDGKKVRPAECAPPPVTALVFFSPTASAAALLIGERGTAAAGRGSCFNAM